MLPAFPHSPMPYPASAFTVAYLIAPFSIAVQFLNVFSASPRFLPTFPLPPPPCLPLRCRPRDVNKMQSSVISCECKSILRNLRVFRPLKRPNSIVAYPMQLNSSGFECSQCAVGNGKLLGILTKENIILADREYGLEVPNCKLSEISNL